LDQIETITDPLDLGRKHRMRNDRDVRRFLSDYGLSVIAAPVLDNQGKMDGKQSEFFL
jgi:hypothetical protein